ADAAPVLPLDDGRLQAELGRPDRGGISTRARAQDHDVKMVAHSCDDIRPRAVLASADTLGDRKPIAQDHPSLAVKVLGSLMRTACGEELSGFPDVHGTRAPGRVVLATSDRPTGPHCASLRDAGAQLPKTARRVDRTRHG